MKKTISITCSAFRKKSKKSCSFWIKSVYLSDYQSSKYNEQLYNKVRENSRDIKTI